MPTVMRHTPKCKDRDLRTMGRRSRRYAKDWVDATMPDQRLSGEGGVGHERSERQPAHNPIRGCR